MCVLLVTFPPSKNFETSLRAFMQQATSQHEGRVDIMAKYCLRRLSYISKKGPRGKPPSVAEIETASVSSDCLFPLLGVSDTPIGIIVCMYMTVGRSIPPVDLWRVA